MWKTREGADSDTEEFYTQVLTSDAQEVRFLAKFITLVTEVTRLRRV